jgi:hypothetical protein
LALQARSAFVGSSHGYINTCLKLATLVGKTVTFRWRMGLDDDGFARGWWVDNVKLYTRVTPQPRSHHNICVNQNTRRQSLELTASIVSMDER